MRLMIGCVGVALMFVLTPVAAGQDAGAAKLEIIVFASGEPATPWMERTLCHKTTGKCEVSVMNPETGEVARWGGVLGTDFELSGSGQEVRRAESALSKAARPKQ